MTDITDEYWALFEQKFNIARTDVVNVKNIYRHRCSLFVHKDDLDAWNYKYEDWNGRTDVRFNFYEIMFKMNDNHVWILHSV
jgi:hypothetical protein